MTPRVGAYRRELRGLADPEPYLRERSGLPGPRANLELARAAADVADARLIRRWAELDAEEAPENTPEAFLAVCGVVGLGRLLAEGDETALALLRERERPRWRIREAVAIALQRAGEDDVARLVAWMRDWAGGGALERRAAIAALCEPALLGNAGRAREVLDLLDGVTASLAASPERRGEDVRVLRTALGYCWSVAVAASPEAGRRTMERWLESDDPDVAWVMRENLHKARLTRMDPEWVERARARIAGCRPPSPPSAR